MLNDEEHNSNMQRHRSRNELWSKEEVKEMMMMLGSEVAIPEACITKKTVPSCHFLRHRETKLLIHRKRASCCQEA